MSTACVKGPEVSEQSADVDVSWPRTSCSSGPRLALLASAAERACSAHADRMSGNATKARRACQVEDFHVQRRASSAVNLEQMEERR